MKKEVIVCDYIGKNYRGEKTMYCRVEAHYKCFICNADCCSMHSKHELGVVVCWACARVNKDIENTIEQFLAKVEETKIQTEREFKTEFEKRKEKIFADAQQKLKQFTRENGENNG